MSTVHFEFATFFRQAPNALLAEYFHARDLLRDVPFSTLRSRDVVQILAGVQALPPEALARVEAELRDVHLVARCAGAAVIQDELTLRGFAEAATEIGTLANDHARALRLFLDHGGVPGSAFDAVRGYAHARGQSRSRLRRRSGLPRVLPLVDELARRRLADAMREHFKPQGRARHCEVLVHERLNPHRFCFFAYPEDYPATPLTIDENGLGSAPHNPVFEVAFIWRWEEGVLEVGAPGARSDIDALAARFRAAVLPEVALGGNARSLRVHPVLDPGFRFPTDAQDGILDVEVAGVRFAARDRGGARLEIQRGEDETLHAFLQRAVDVEALYDRGLDLSMVKLRVLWRGIGRRKPTTTTFHLLMPDGTDLSDDPKHQVIRRYLTRWQLAA